MCLAPLAPFIFFTPSKYLINISIFQFIVEFSLSGYFLSSLGSTDCVIFVAEYSDIFFKFEVENPNWTSRRPTARWSLLYSYVSLVSYIVSCQIWRVTLRFCRAFLPCYPTFLAAYIFFVVKNLKMNDKIYTFVITNLYYIIYGIYKKPTCTSSTPI